VLTDRLNGVRGGADTFAPIDLLNCQAGIDTVVEHLGHDGVRLCAITSR
jgi:hypothetical protein